MPTIQIRNRHGQVRTVNVPAGKSPFSFAQDGETIVLPMMLTDNGTVEDDQLTVADTRRAAYEDFCARLQDAWRGNDAAPAPAPAADANSAYVAYCRRVSDAWRGAR